MKHIFRLLASARQLWRYYIVIGLLSVLTSLTLILIPLLTGWAVDEVRKGTGARVGYVVVLALLLFAMDFIGNVLNNVNGYIGDLMSVKLRRTLSGRYYEQLLSLPQGYFDSELSGKIINRLSRSITQITDFMQMFSNNFLQFMIGTVFALAMVAYYSWPVAVMLFLLYPIYIWMTVRTSNTWQRYQAKKNLHFDIASGRFAEVVNQIKVVKSFIRQRHELKFFDRHMRIVEETNEPQSRYWHKKDFWRRFVLNLIFLSVYLYVFVAAAKGNLTPGQAVALVLFAQQIRIPIFTISFLVENTQRAIADSKDYFEIMKMQPDIQDHSDAASLQVPDGRIEFKNVSFGYDASQPVLKSISVTIEPNAKVALVGESGEGKTTLTNLLLRLYEPEKGRILIDGQNIDAVTQESLRKNIGVVFQEPALFSGTIKENIAYANPMANNKQIITAAKAANAHEFIQKLDKGYETQIGERGLKLSGGQKQRIAIARALLKNAPILVLDEATSSLDSKSEVLVQEALNRLMKNRTTIIIAHRLSTIQNVDTIITLKRGRIDEVGEPDKLKRSGGIYAELLRLQVGHTEAGKKELTKYEIAA